MDFGIHLPHAGKFATAQGVIRSAQAAEQLGYGSVWLYDHLITPYESRSVYPGTADGKYPMQPDEPYFDSIALMGALAVATHRITFGVRVMVAALRHPVVMAKELATIDCIAGGRMTICVGAGWMVEEFDAVDVPYDKRFNRMDEHVAVLHGAWRNGISSFSGEHYEHVEAGFYPRPPRGDIPVLVGGITDAALRRVARYGDGWAAMVPNEQMPAGGSHRAIPGDVLKPRLDLLREMCEEEGRTYDELQIIAQASTKDSYEAFQTYAELGVTTTDLVIWGDEEKVIRDATAFAERIGTSL